MADSLFRRPYYWDRLRGNPLGEVIQDYATHFRDLGYSWVTIRKRVHSLEHFGCWLRSNGVSPKAVTPKLVRSFIRDHLPKCRCPRPAPVAILQVRPALNHLLRFLRARGLLNESICPRPIDVVIDQFRIYLRDVAGLSESTCTSRTRYAREFLEKKFGRRKPRWTALLPSDVISFVTSYAGRYRPQSIQGVASSLRCFFRYLQVQGKCGSSLLDAVPCVAHSRLSSVPRALSEEQVSAFLSTFDRSTANGLRDYAMGLCQVVLGLRVGEVANLKLDDIDWRTGTVRIENSKGRRRRELPLPVRVGRALTSYLRQGRPPAECRNVFVRLRGARAVPVSISLIQGVMRQACTSVPSCEHLCGTHFLRHTAATQMLRKGASLKEIADVLGHSSLETTTIYTKVDLPSLNEVALPWPEVGHE